MGRRIGWAWTLGAITGAACASAPGTPAGPASSWSGPAATVAVSTASASGGWAPVASARSTASARPAGTGLAACVADLRSSHLDAPDDETELYATALNDERSNRILAARKAYYDLLTRSPGSLYMPMLYLAFGEMFAADAATDPSKWGLARQAFQEVVKYPPERNLAFAYAHLRVAEAALRLDEAPAALDGGRRALTAARGQVPCGALIQARALELTVEAYAVSGRPERAPLFFQSLLGPGADVDAPLVALGQRYRTTGKPREACALASSAASERVRESLRPGCPP